LHPLNLTCFNDGNSTRSQGKSKGGQAAFAFPALALLLVIQPDEQSAA
jgi:hypothetical protein